LERAGVRGIFYLAVKNININELLERAEQTKTQANKVGKTKIF
jgi:hypothetical protein